MHPLFNSTTADRANWNLVRDIQYNHKYSDSIHVDVDPSACDSCKSLSNSAAKERPILVNAHKNESPYTAE